MARGYPVQNGVIPPELLVRPTEVVEYGSPEANVFEPNAIGSMGNANIPHEDLWKVGLDPYRSMGGDPGSSALRGAQTLVEKLLWNHRANQAPDTHILEHEGGSSVEYHEPTIDDQTINVGGVEIDNGVEGLEHLARNLHTQEHQRSPVGIQQSRNMVNRLASGMARDLQSSFVDVLRRIGADGVSSLSADPLPGTLDRVEMASDSGVVMSGDGAEAHLRDLMHQRALQQNMNAPRPMARFHPGQSNYSSPNGQVNFGQLPFPTGPSAVESPTIIPFRTPILPTFPTPTSTPSGSTTGSKATTVSPATSSIKASSSPLPTASPLPLPAFIMPTIPLPKPAATQPTQPGPTGPLSTPTMPSGGSSGPGPVGPLPTPMTPTPRLPAPSGGGGAGYTVIPAPRPPAAGLPGGGGGGDMEPEGPLDWGPPPPGTGSEDTCSQVMPDGTIAYGPCPPGMASGGGGYQVVIGPQGPNWLMIGGIAASAAALIGIALIATRK